MIKLIALAVIIGAAWWFRGLWLHLVKNLAKNSLSSVLMPRRELDPPRLLNVIVKTATRQIPKLADASYAFPRSFTVYLSARDYDTVHIDVDSMRNEVIFRILKFAEVNGNLTKPWWPEVGFEVDPTAVDGWPLARPSHNKADTTPANPTAVVKKSDDDDLRRRVDAHYSGSQPAANTGLGLGLTASMPPQDLPDYQAPHRPSPEPEVDDGAGTVYSGQSTQYATEDTFGPLYQDIPTTLVPLDPTNPKIELTEETLIRRATVGGCGDVSRRHCTIEPVKNGWVLTDKGSTNGTLVNGIPVRGTKPLVDGDKIRFGAQGPTYLFNRTRPPVGKTPSEAAGEPDARHAA